MPIIERLMRWLEVPINLLLWIALLAGFLMMMHVAVDVGGRAFARPLDGTTEIVSAWYMVAVCYLPWAWVTRHDNQIVAGVFEHIGTAWFGYWVEVCVKILVLVYVSVFCWQTGVRALQQTEAGEVWEAGSSFIAVWPSRWILPISAGLMALYLVLRILRDVGRGYQQEAHEEGEVREGGV